MDWKRPDVRLLPVIGSSVKVDGYSIDEKIGTEDIKAGDSEGAGVDEGCEVVCGDNGKKEGTRLTSIPVQLGSNSEKACKKPRASLPRSYSGLSSPLKYASIQIKSP